ncbi:hypothetical protein Cgig2_015355 [Carnegiea gigantea]|uniref:Uncharacterized protein n=1 Tax=Carnegiea gigantea TaxID=171969 RepID=A0A9Q1K789_9CARY|nr:hypothetical protein Cgig2_015355 [Carnegiea gigantea]
MVLGYIYEHLGESASHPDHPCKANVIFPSHYVVARHVFRDGRYISLIASFHCEDSRNDRDVIDMGLPDEDFKFLLSIWSSVLPQQRSIMELTHAHADLQRRDTGAKFYVPPSHYEGIEEIFGVVETVAKIEELVDVDWVKALSDQDLTCLSEIAQIEGQLNNMSSETSKLRVKEQEILREEERICNILIEEESKLKSFVYPKKREVEQVKANLIEAGFSKLQDLDKEKDRLKNLISFVISFNNV